MEVLRLLACLPDIYLKTRTKEQLVLIMGDIQPSLRKLPREEVLKTVLQYKKEVLDNHQKLRVQEELERYRKQVNQLLKAIVEPSAIAGYHPEHDRVQIINRLQSADFGDYDEKLGNQPKTIEELIESLYEGDDDPWEDEEYEDSLDQSETVGTGDRLDWRDWRETSEDSGEEKWRVDI